MIVADPNERDEPILVFRRVAGSKDIFLVQFLEVVGYHRAEPAHLLENGGHSGRALLDPGELASRLQKISHRPAPEILAAIRGRCLLITKPTIIAR